MNAWLACEPVPITRAPRATAIWTARCPTPPAAPWTRTASGSGSADLDGTRAHADSGQQDAQRAVTPVGGEANPVGQPTARAAQPAGADQRLFFGRTGRVLPTGSLCTTGNRKPLRNHSYSAVDHRSGGTERTFRPAGSTTRGPWTRPFRTAADFTGVPVMVTENGIATADDEDRIALHRRGAARPVDRDRRRRRRPRVHALEPAGQLRVDARLPAHVRPGARGPGDLRPDAEAEPGVARRGGRRNGTHLDGDTP